MKKVDRWSLSVPLLALLVGTPVLSAQSWGVTAAAPLDGGITASAAADTLFDSGTSPIAVGPVAAGLFAEANALAGGAATNGSASWSAAAPGQVGPVGFTVSANLSSSLWLFPSSVGWAASTADFTLDVTLTAPTPVSGFLQLDTFADAGAVSVDVGADGTFELPNATPFVDSSKLTVPVTIPAQGLVVRVGFSLSAILFNAGALGDSGFVRGEFYPGSVMVAEHVVTNANTFLRPRNYGNGLVDIDLSTPGHTPLLLAFGLSEVVLPLQPLVTQLVAADAIFSIGNITLQLPPLPPGFAMYAQGVAIDGQGNLVGSNSVRALWF